MMDRAHYGNPWSRLSVGVTKPLSNSRIMHYARAGRYGDRWKRYALAVEAARLKRGKRVQSLDKASEPCVKCGVVNDSVKWCNQNYIPKVGNYCSLCKTLLRTEAQTPKRRSIEQLLSEYA